jgi:protein SFI1
VSDVSAVAVPELVGLTHQDVTLLDAVIERAGPSATTFLTVFKAYNDILQERGLDPHEVLYYGKLLKLGTVKGKNWGEKWSIVKLQHGYGGKRGTDAQCLDLLTLTTTPTRLNLRPKASLHDDDALSLHSHQDDTETIQSNLDTDTEANVHQYHQTPRPVSRRPLSPTPSTTATTMLDLDAMSTSSQLFVPEAHPVRATPPMPTRSKMLLHPEVSEMTDDSAATPSAIPPSYRAAIRDHQRPAHQVLPQPRSNLGRPFSPSVTPSAAARHAIARAREQRGRVINEDEAWNKIKMARDEKDADRFHEDRLLERCWEIWKEGFRWIIVRSVCLLAFFFFAKI